MVQLRIRVTLASVHKASQARDTVQIEADWSGSVIYSRLL